MRIGHRRRSPATGPSRRELRKYENQLHVWQAERDALAELLEFALNGPGGTAPGFVGQPGETVFVYMTNTSLVEERRQPGHYQAHSREIPTPFGFGIKTSGAASGRRYVQGPSVPTAIDTGTVYVTNRRLIFKGRQQTRECRFDRTIGVSHEPRRGVTVISVTNRQKPVVIQYGPKVAKWFSSKMDLGLAQYRGALEAEVARLTAELAQIDATRPVPQPSPREP